MNDARCLSRLESARVGITMVAPVVVSPAHARRSITHRGSIVTSVRLDSSSPLKRHWPWPGLEHQEAGAAHPTEATQPDRVRRDLEAAVRVRDDLAQVVQAREGSKPRRPRPESAR